MPPDSELSDARIQAVQVMGELYGDLLPQIRLIRFVANRIGKDKFDRVLEMAQQSEKLSNLLRDLLSFGACHFSLIATDPDLELDMPIDPEPPKTEDPQP